MNAQEALKEIIRLFDYVDLPIDYRKFIELKDGVTTLQQLVTQSNAKPKTLEELGWEFVEHNSIFGITYTSYEKANQTIHFRQTERKVRIFDFYCGDIRPCDLTHEEILAIAEKMKELGMSSEQIAKGETK